jgi:methionine sulfoxide reductase heme-binding subunit
MGKVLSSKWTKVFAFLLCLVPLLQLGWGAYAQKLGANPIEKITHKTGDWTIRFLLITLSVTPLRKLLNEPKLARFRRMLGLFAFFYGTLHLTTWIWLDKFFDLNEMWQDVLKRRFITVGMLGFVLMIPLAITSTAGWVRRLGYVRWQRLHRLVYFSALAGVIHYYWLVKSDVRLPLLYMGILAVLMIYRLVTWMWSKSTKRHVSAAPMLK